MKYNININQYAVINNGIELDIIDLAIFDFIRDFANSPKCTKIQTPEGIYFWVSHSLIIEAMPILKIKTKQGIIKRIDNLINAGILAKHPNCEIYNKSLYAFGKNYDLLTFTEVATEINTPKQLFTGGVNESLDVPLNESLGNNIINNNIINNNIEALPQHTTNKKTLFRNSEIYALVVNGDYSAFEALFATPEFTPVDLVYYFHAVADWSDQRDMKRTKNGWLATIRNFIRGDAERGRVHYKQSDNMSGAMEYLNGYE